MNPSIQKRTRSGALWLLVGAAGLTAGAALAEAPSEPAAAAEGVKAQGANQAEGAKAQADDKAEAAKAQADDKAKKGIAGALRLPVVAKKARDKGVPTKDIREALRAMRNAEVEPEESTTTLDAAVSAVEEKGPIENFGKFVKSKVEDGLRGKELAAAIRAEHKTRGIGQGKKLPDPEAKEHGKMGHGPGKGEEKPEGADEETGRDKGEAMMGKKPGDPAAQGKGSPGQPAKAGAKGNPGGSEKAGAKGNPGQSEKAAPQQGGKGKGK